MWFHFIRNKKSKHSLAYLNWLIDIAEYETVEFDYQSPNHVFHLVIPRQDCLPMDMAVIGKRGYFTGYDISYSICIILSTI